ncbi:AAA family ATPase [uncultured Legionella sp.]|uniref:AAA family ATPase n=1 Tax=uncultured Legionella sp. TaxID=210934 RepID=UPI002625AECE|nr:AAA family ATPase [uncultured Legionella sp.]
MIELERARSALATIDPGCSREKWIQIGMAAKAARLSFEDFHNWSKNGSNYLHEKDCLTAWESFDKSGRITEATLFHIAKENGWKNHEVRDISIITANKNAEAKQNKKAIAETVVNDDARVLGIWNASLLADKTHPYIAKKQGNPHGLRVYPEDAPPLTIAGQNVAGFLVVPCWNDNKLQTLQFIPPNGGKKLNLNGAEFNDGYFTVGQITGIAYICEGLGAAWPINQLTNLAAVVCFGSGRMKRVVKTLRIQYPSLELIIIPDRGKEKLAQEIAIEMHASWIELPQLLPDNYDIGDYAQEFGHKELRLLLNNKKSPPLPLNTIFADELPETFSPADELLEGVLISGDGSILYGDSNSGKTFFVIDMACAIARGIDWMGRKTEQGLVIYLAAESPTSVKRRLQAYQKYHNVRVKNFAIVQNPINLFDGDTDTAAVIALVHLLEQQYKQKVRFIVGDTLARLSAGANENAGQDMGLVVRHFDRIRSECNAHFMLIHHGGKNAAAGARGWSGVRAAVDTEIEVTDSAMGRCAEITKQRDLSSKGIRIGFELEKVTLGVTKWGYPATSCIVTSTEAPIKSTSKRFSEIGEAIYAYIFSFEKPIKKRDLVKHFEGQYNSSAIYRQLKKLVGSGKIIESMGVVNKVPIGAN